MSPVEKQIANCFVLLLALLVTYFPHQSVCNPRGRSDIGELKLEPAEVIAYAGDNVTFTCSMPSNASFQWVSNHNVQPYKITNGVITNDDTNTTVYWSSFTLVAVRRIMSGEVSCSAEGSQHSAVAFLIVNGVEIGGACRTQDCITHRAVCKEGICACADNDVLLRLSESGYQVCRKMIYKLYDSCDLSEQCFHLVDSKSVCDRGICVCAAWAFEVDGKCVSKGEITYNRNQEMYRVGLIAITCVIIIVVALSLWITLRRSCEETTDGQRRAITQNENENPSDVVAVEVSNDKPPSYNEILETDDTVASPPNFIEALKNSVTSKKLLRQVSAPAGELLTRPKHPTIRTDPQALSNCPIFTIEGSNK